MDFRELFLSRHAPETLYPPSNPVRPQCDQNLDSLVCSKFYCIALDRGWRVWFKAYLSAMGTQARTIGIRYCNQNELKRMRFGLPEFRRKTTMSCD